jgi:hypothetical protein
MFGVRGVRFCTRMKAFRTNILPLSSGTPQGAFQMGRRIHTFDSEDGRSMFLRNVCIGLQHNTPSQNHDQQADIVAICMSHDAYR